MTTYILQGRNIREYGNTFTDTKSNDNSQYLNLYNLQNFWENRPNCLNLKSENY